MPAWLRPARWSIWPLASRYAGEKTIHYCLLFFLVGPVVLGIAYLVWHHNLCARVGDELTRRGITNCRLSGADYWLWGILGSFIIIGPFVSSCKLFNAMNILCASYNQSG